MNIHVHMNELDVEKSLIRQQPTIQAYQKGYNMS